MSATLLRSHIDTPLGPMIAIASDDALCFLEYDSPKRLSLLARRVVDYFPGYTLQEGRNPVIRVTEHWLSRFFGNAFDDRDRPELELRGTPFEMRVWSVLLGIKAGETTTYGQVARKLGKPNASRAVGGASRRNPVSIIVPCHRVVGADGSLTGYGGGLRAKEWLLQHER